MLEEEALRAEVLSEVAQRNITFRSEPADVLEYAVYLGMVRAAPILPPLG